MLRARTVPWCMVSRTAPWLTDHHAYARHWTAIPMFHQSGVMTCVALLLHVTCIMRDNNVVESMLTQITVLITENCVPCMTTCIHLHLGMAVQTHLSNGSCLIRPSVACIIVVFAE